MKGAPGENEKPLTDLDFARKLKALGRVPEGPVATVARLREVLLEQAAASEFAGRFGAARALRMLERGFKDDRGDDPHVHASRTAKHRRSAKPPEQTKTEARHTAILLLCKEHNWHLNMRTLAEQLEQKLMKDLRFRDKDNEVLFPVSRRTIDRDLRTLLARTT